MFKQTTHVTFDHNLDKRGPIFQIFQWLIPDDSVDTRII